MESTGVEKVEIEILHKKFTISCKVGESDAYRKSAKEINEQVAEMQSLTGNRLPLESVLSLVAVNNCKEKLAKDAEFAKEISTLKSKVATLISKLDKIGADLP